MLGALAIASCTSGDDHSDPALLSRRYGPQAPAPSTSFDKKPMIVLRGLEKMPVSRDLKDFMTGFEGGNLQPSRLDPHVNYQPSAPRFYVHLPDDYSSKARYGLVVFIDSGDEVRAEPDEWAPVLDHRKLLFIAPLNAGNDRDDRDRMGLAVLAALQMLRHYPIDPGRIYVAGFSGGARMASRLGFYQPDLFRGTIQNCGTDFYRHVPQVVATTRMDTAGKPYGLLDATPEEIDRARRVRFALVTGSDDFRHGNIVDLFHGGFEASGFQARLFDVPGMRHDTADARTLNAVLDFIDPAPQ
jgi:pimeloyl-ACP methyl ester carboxylesterase